MKRVRWVISYNKRAQTWFATVKGVGAKCYATQREAISETAAACRKLLPALSEMIIKGLDGRIRDNRTYGADPRGTKG